MQLISRSQQGLTMVESLVALIVISIGLLGIAALQLTSMKNNSSALHHSKAVWAGYNMADRIRSNGARFADYNGVDTENGYAQDCTNSACNDTQMVDADAADWTDKVRELPGGRGLVTGDPERLTVTVMWDDEGTGANGTNCSGNTQVDLTCYSITLLQ